MCSSGYCAQLMFMSITRDGEKTDTGYNRNIFHGDFVYIWIFNKIQ